MTSGMKPMSDIWSASSRTMISTWVQVAGAAVDDVAQPAGGGDEDVDAALQRVDLVATSRYRRRRPSAAGRAPSRTAQGRRRPAWPARGSGPGSGRGGAWPGCGCRRGGPAAAGRSSASCRSRYGHGPGCPCRPARPGWSRPGSGTGSVTPFCARVRTRSAGRPRSPNVRPGASSAPEVSEVSDVSGASEASVVSVASGAVSGAATASALTRASTVSMESFSGMTAWSVLEMDMRNAKPSGVSARAQTP